MSNWDEPQKEAYRKQQALDTPVAEMALSVRVINTLEENGVIMACDVVKQTYDSLMGMKNFGDKTLTEVRDALRALGLEPPAWEKPPKLKPLSVPRKNSHFGTW